MRITNCVRWLPRSLALIAALAIPPVLAGCTTATLSPADRQAALQPTTGVVAVPRIDPTPSAPAATAQASPISATQAVAIIDWVDFIMLDGITYTASDYTNFGEVGRSLKDTDLGPEYATVKNKLDGNVFDTRYRPRNGDAAFLEAGTPVYLVNGYSPRFRLAARRNGRTLLYEADTNPAARKGADLLDVGGKVRRIGVNDQQDGMTELGSIEDPLQVEALAGMVAQAPVNQSLQQGLAYNSSGPRYFIAFYLQDGTAINRAYWPDSGELSRGIILSGEFRAAIKQALQK